jgi:hypothetical protein
MKSSWLALSQVGVARRWNLERLRTSLVTSMSNAGADRSMDCKEEKATLAAAASEPDATFSEVLGAKENFPVPEEAKS